MRLAMVRLSGGEPEFDAKYVRTADSSWPPHGWPSRNEGKDGNSVAKFGENRKLFVCHFHALML